VTTQTTYYPWETRLSIFQRTRERGWGCGLIGRVPAWEQGPEFKPQDCKKKKNKLKNNNKELGKNNHPTYHEWQGLRTHISGHQDSSSFPQVQAWALPTSLSGLRFSPGASGLYWNLNIVIIIKSALVPNPSSHSNSPQVKEVSSIPETGHLSFHSRDNHITHSRKFLKYLYDNKLLIQR
jgi:hypothetical protein